jgi:hypothetical protein
MPWAFWHFLKTLQLALVSLEKREAQTHLNW